LLEFACYIRIVTCHVTGFSPIRTFLTIMRYDNIYCPISTTYTCTKRWYKVSPVLMH